MDFMSGVMQQSGFFLFVNSIPKLPVGLLVSHSVQMRFSVNFWVVIRTGFYFIFDAFLRISNAKSASRIFLGNDQIPVFIDDAEFKLIRSGVDIFEFSS